MTASARSPRRPRSASYHRIIKAGIRPCIILTCFESVGRRVIRGSLRTGVRSVVPEPDSRSTHIAAKGCSAPDAGEGFLDAHRRTGSGVHLLHVSLEPRQPVEH